MKGKEHRWTERASLPVASCPADAAGSEVPNPGQVPLQKVRSPVPWPFSRPWMPGSRECEGPVGHWSHLIPAGDPPRKPQGQPRGREDNSAWDWGVPGLAVRTSARYFLTGN